MYDMVWYWHNIKDKLKAERRDARKVLIETFGEVRKVAMWVSKENGNHNNLEVGIWRFWNDKGANEARRNKEVNSISFCILVKN